MDCRSSPHLTRAGSRLDTRRAPSHRVAVAAAGVRSAGRARNPNCQSPTCPILCSPLIELPLIIYGRGLKRNKQLSRLRPEKPTAVARGAFPSGRRRRCGTSGASAEARAFRFSGRDRKCNKPHALCGSADLDRPCQMTAKGNRRGQPRRDVRKLIASPDDKIILAVSRGMSNIFLHSLQGVEKKEEMSFSPPASCGTLRLLGLSL